jgi:hypothetical protein
VIKTKISVTIAGNSPIGPTIDQRPQLFQLLPGPLPEPIKYGLAHRLPNERSGLIEVVLGISLDGGESRRFCDPRSSIGLAVEVSQASGQLVEPAITRREAIAKPILVGQPHHLDGPFDRLSPAPDFKPIPRTGDGHHAEVDVRGEAAVEPDFLLAEVASPFKCGEVNKPQIDRLLQFVRERPGKEDGRDMRLMDLDSLDRMWIRIGPREGID